MTPHEPISGDPLDRSRFPVDPWALIETRFEADDLGVTEGRFDAIVTEWERAS